MAFYLLGALATLYVVVLRFQVKTKESRRRGPRPAREARSVPQRLSHWRGQP